MKPFTPYIVALPMILLTLIGCGNRNWDDIRPAQTFTPGVPVLVGPEDLSSTFSYYNTSPESPNGELIAYVKIFTAQNERYDNMRGELWVCETDLRRHKKVTDLNSFVTHNGVEAQWVDDHTIAYFDDGMIQVVDLEGQPLIEPIKAFSIGHGPHENKILYSQVSPQTGLHTIFEYDLSTSQSRMIADAATFSNIVDQFSSPRLRPMNDRRIRHLKYSPDGSKIAFRFDVGNDGERDKHVVTMNVNGGDIEYFGPKPMHFAWFDNSSIMGHDNQVREGLANDKSARRWSLTGDFIETLTGPGNHLSATTDRSLYATESWYNIDPVVLRAFKRGEYVSFWEDTVSIDGAAVWELGNHVNPAFSRDGKRVYYRKSIAPGRSQAYMVVLPDP